MATSGTDLSWDRSDMAKQAKAVSPLALCHRTPNFASTTFTPLSQCLAALAAAVLLAAVAAAAPEPLTTGPGNDTEARFSPDGRSIVFQSDRSGTLDLYSLDVKNGEVKRLTETPGHSCFPVFSPDGKWIVYSYAHFTKTALEKQEHGYNLFVIPANGGGEPRRLTSGLQRDCLAEFGPDGETVYFTSTRGVDSRYSGEAPPTMVFRMPFAGGDPVPAIQRSSGHMAQPTFSPDGRFVAYGIIEGYDRLWQINVTRLKRLSDYAVNEPDKPRNLWDLGTDFGLEDNPNGQWSYLHLTHYREQKGRGSAAGNPPDTSKAILMSESTGKDEQGKERDGCLDFWYKGDEKKYVRPYIGVARMGGSSGDPYYATFMAGEVGVHPGGDFRPGDGNKSVLAIARWTAPRAGDIIVKGKFSGIADGDRDFYVIRNGTKVLVDQYSFRYTDHPFRIPLKVKAGDTIDMCVGRGVRIPSSMAKVEAMIYYAGHEKLGEQGKLLPTDHNSDRIIGSVKETFYAPRWSPVGNVIACTGFKAGDGGWKPYLIDLKTGAKRRLNGEQPGNSRSPDWSPDGNTIVYENNQTGTYKLFRTATDE